MQRLAWLLVPVAALVGGGCGGGPRRAADLDLGPADAATEGAGAPPDAALAPSPTMGAQVVPGGVRFRVWAPDATSVQAAGSFAGAPLSLAAGPDGVFSATAPAAQVGDTYRYLLGTASGPLTRTDPYCRQLSGTDCVIVDPSAYAWKDPSFTRPPRNQTIVYELHVGSFSVPSGAAQGSFGSTLAALGPVAALGVNAVEVMPVQSFGSAPNTWGYDPQLYLAPRQELGTADDLRALADGAHDLGMSLWLDTVVNHTDGWNQAPLYCFDAPCASGSAGIYYFPAGEYADTPWGPRPDYAEPEVASMLLTGVTAWLDEIHGDGFRWDSVLNVRSMNGTGSVPGGRDLLVAANALIHARGGMSVAEDLQGYGAITQPPGDGGFGFDAQWDGFSGEVTPVLATASDAERDLGAIQSALTGTSGGDPFARVIYLEDHDTVGNGGARLPSLIDPATPESWAARRRSIEGGVLLLSAPGVPMIFMGEEFLATGTFANPPAPLAAPDAAGALVRNFWTDMIALRRNTAGTTGGLTDDNVEILHRNDTAKVIAYRRYGASGQDVIVIVNLGNQAYTEYDIGVADPGPWQIRLTTDTTRYGADFTNGPTGSVTGKVMQKDGKPYALPIVLGAYGAVVFSK